MSCYAKPNPWKEEAAQRIILMKDTGGTGLMYLFGHKDTSLCHKKVIHVMVTAKITSLTLLLLCGPGQ